MEDRECRWCIHFNGGNCSKIQEEFEVDNNLDKLVEDGELIEYLRETVTHELKPFLKKKTFEDDAEEILQAVTDEVYNFFLSNLETSFKIPVDTEFSCKYWR